jgi:diacylglycerol diphosphate phosphatase / phosphatidate phosphatase
MDARHHPFDVLFGSAMGILVAWGSYRQYFPPVGNSWLKGRAYPIRTWGKEMKTLNEPEGIAMEPLRQPANLAAAQEPPQGANGNVFRDQLSRSQRQRGDPATLDSGNAPPFARQRDHDWSEPTSDDEEAHFREDAGFRGSAELAMPEQRSFA